MGVVVYKPTTIGHRNISTLVSPEIKKGSKIKSLWTPKKRISGRNNQGRITIRHRGGGEKKFYRLLDFKRQIRGISGKVVNLEYDPNRTANIALLEYENGQKDYIIAPNGLRVGDTVISDDKTPVKLGNHMLLKNMPIGTMIHNIEIAPERGGGLVRTAGAVATLLSMEGDAAYIKLPSGEIRKFSVYCRATIGTVGRIEWSNVRIGKAGRMRHMGRRPQVRGKAMNPVDHPHGGGEGLSPIGLKYPKTPWGAVALGKKTRKNRSSNKLMIKRRK